MADMHSMSCHKAIALALSALLWSPVVAQAADAAPTADLPGAGPTVRYESALKDYRRYQDEPVASWKNANDLVGKIGGWRAYARESGATRDDPSAKSAPPTAPSPAGAHAPAHHAPASK